MFVQVIRGPISVEHDAMEMFDRWLEELRPGAEGWLGTTAGVTPSGQLLAVVRFASEEEARRNSERREQGAWWTEMEKRFSGPPTFHDCTDVATFLGGGDDRAGFVQIMESRGDGSYTAADLAEAAGDTVSEYRPDVLGGLVAIADDGTTFQVVYFTSEDEARQAEAQPMPEAVEDALERMMSSFESLAYHDLPRPRLTS